MGPVGRAVGPPISSKHSALIRVLLQHFNDQQRKHFIIHADRAFIDCLCECALNILRGNVPLGKSAKSVLKKHANDLRKLTDQRISITSKRKILYQSCGSKNVGGESLKFLRALLTPIVALIPQ